MHAPRSHARLHALAAGAGSKGQKGVKHACVRVTACPRKVQHRGSNGTGRRSYSKEAGAFLRSQSALSSHAPPPKA